MGSKTGKLRMDLVPPEAEEALARVFQYGANKHGERQWETGSWKRSEIFAACKRHLNSLAKGEENDPESGLSHLDHALANLAILIAYRERDLGVKDFPPLRKGKKDVQPAI